MHLIVDVYQNCVVAIYNLSSYFIIIFIVYFLQETLRKLREQEAAEQLQK